MATNAPARLEVTVICDDEAYQVFDTARLRALLEAAIVGEDLPDAALSVRFIDEATSQQLHADHFDINESTDVMTFPGGTTDPERAQYLLGDLAICPAIAEQRVAQGLGQTSLAEEVELYCLHGLLHLLGFDDQDPEDRLIMWQRQAEIVAPFFELKSHGDEHGSHVEPEQ
jgi:probable rRNA maturation factor